MSLIGREVGGGLGLPGQARVIDPNGSIGAVLPPPLDDFLEKGIFRPGGKEVAVEVSCLRIKQNKYRHGCGFLERWSLHGLFIFFLYIHTLCSLETLFGRL